MNIRLLLPLLTLFALPTQAAVYKCTLNGQLQYSDKPCAREAQPATLPPLTEMDAAKPSALSKQYDQSVAHDKKARDAADAAWVKAQQAEAKRAVQAREAIIHHRVHKGMTRSEVASALGSPESSDALGRSTYRDGTRQIIVSFENDHATRISEASGLRRGHRRHK